MRCMDQLRTFRCLLNPWVPKHETNQSIRAVSPDDKAAIVDNRTKHVNRDYFSLTSQPAQTLQVFNSYKFSGRFEYS